MVTDHASHGSGYTWCWRSNNEACHVVNAWLHCTWWSVMCIKRMMCAYVDVCVGGCVWGDPCGCMCVGVHVGVCDCVCGGEGRGRGTSVIGANAQHTHTAQHWLLV